MLLEKKTQIETLDLTIKLSFLIFPLTLFLINWPKSDLSKFYLGDLLGPRIDLESKLLISKSLAEALTLRSMTFGVGEKFYPMFAPEVEKTLGKWLLSFGPWVVNNLAEFQSLQHISPLV